MFIILSHQRSGTHLLASLLNSHPELKCYDEIFAKNEVTKFGKKDLHKIGENEGFILMYAHYLGVCDKRPFIRKQKIIHLTRESIENHAKSLKTTVPKAKKRIDFFRRMTFRDKFEKMFEITYEQICGDKSISEYRNDDLLKFLGVKPMKLTTDFVKGKDP